jgi:phenylacetate-CoA ligase
MSNFAQLRLRHVADAAALAPEMTARIGWSADRLAAYRQDRLRALVTSAVARSPWHAERLAGLDVGRLDETSLRELPTMTKDELMDGFDEVVTDERLTLARVNDHLAGLPQSGYLFDRYTAVASGGSTGRRGVFVYDWTEWTSLYVGLARYLLRAAAGWRQASGTVVLASVAAGHPTHPTAAWARTFAGFPFDMVPLPVTLPVEEIVSGLNAVQPQVLFAYPSALHLLTSEVAAGRLRITPRRILVAAEPLLPEIRAAAERAWGQPVHNWWGASEAGGLGNPCELGRTHLGEDQVIIEPVDADGRPVPPGVPSDKIYLTNLYNHTLPLIRYEITDQVNVLPERCPCGSVHRLIDDIQGRLDDVFRYRGRVVHPHVFRSALGRRATIVEYQVRQSLRGAEIDVRCCGPLDIGSLQRDIVHALGRVGLTNPEVRVSTVERIERGVAGKLRRFVPLSAVEPAVAMTA